MSVASHIVKNDIFVYEDGDVPVFKVAGFDGYDFAQLGVTSQFLDDAETYYERYTKPDHFRDLYGIALSRLNIDDGKLSILDIGTGGGNSIFALVELLGAHRIDALGVDISPQLLSLCAKVGERKYGLTSKNLRLLCADLYDLDLESESVDLVAGSSILHHMIDPAPIVTKALNALRPEGSAIFTEPFEDGHGILRATYASMLSLEATQNDKLPEYIRAFLVETSQDFDARRGIGDVREYTQFLDDKWYFTRTWFQRLAVDANCDLRIIPTHGGDQGIFWRQFESALRLHNNGSAEELPEWAKDLVRSLDNTFSAPQRNDFAFTGIVVMTKR